MTKITLRGNIENNFYLRKQNRGNPEFWRKAKEQMTECTTSHFTLTKYVTVENMASSPIQNIKCSPKSNLREGKILFPSQRIWTCCYWFYKKWKRPHMFVCFIELTYLQLIAPNLYMIKKRLILLVSAWPEQQQPVGGKNISTFSTYLIFVIFFTRAKFLENKIYNEKTRKLQQNTQ